MKYICTHIESTYLIRRIISCAYGSHGVVFDLLNFHSHVNITAMDIDGYFFVVRQLDATAVTGSGVSAVAAAKVSRMHHIN